MSKKAKTVEICSKVMDREYKCGGCNWDMIVAYYFSDEKEPEFESAEDDTLTNGCCASCFVEMLEGCKIVKE
jgi:hypothetical protein